MKKTSFIIFLATLFLGIIEVRAGISLPSLISDNMVLQQNSKVKLWGKASLGEKLLISSSWSKKVYSVQPDSSGKWSLYIKTPKYCTGQSLVFKSENSGERIEINNILIGEVWLASGQSNMEFHTEPKKGTDWMTGMYNWEKEIENADYPYIHLFKVEEKWDYNAPQENCNGKWEVCSKEVARSYSAIAFLFARELYNRLNRPVGIILCAFGGTHAESWTRLDIMQNDSLYSNVLKNYTPEKMQAKNYQHKVPAAIWNAMVNPIVGYTVKGNIWYQAESNAWRAKDYAPIFVNMVNDWRDLWQQKRLPFYIMQVAPFATMPGIIREQQAKVWKEAGVMADKTFTLKDIGMATAIDTGDSLDIHPKEKLIPAKRLAAWALNREYGEDIECCGPVLTNFKLKGNCVELKFNHAEGLYIKDLNNKGADYLYIAGADSVYHKASAILRGNKLIVWSNNVKNPAYIRYCTDDYCKGNIYNRYALPAYPFRIELKKR